MVGGTRRLNDDLKLGESTFLNTPSRLAKVPAPEEIARYTNWNISFCHALSRTCHAPVMTKSMLILVMTKISIDLVVTKISIDLVLTKISIRRMEGTVCCLHNRTSRIDLVVTGA